MISPLEDQPRSPTPRRSRPLLAELALLIAVAGLLAVYFWNHRVLLGAR